MCCFVENLIKLAKNKNDFDEIKLRYLKPDKNLPIYFILLNHISSLIFLKCFIVFYITKIIFILNKCFFC